MRGAPGMLAMLTTALVPAGAWAEGHAWAKRHRGSRAPAASHRVEPAGDRAYSAIVGGHFARDGQFPWVAKVVARNGKRLDLCTGTVVAANLILTAGHCAEDVQTGVPREPTDFAVQTAAAFARPRTSKPSRVSRVLVYPGFEPKSGVGDAALLELSTPTAVPSIRLAGEADDWPAGTHALMTGWGRTDAARRRTDPRFLRWATTVVQSSEWCAAHLRGFHARRQLCSMNAPRDNTAGCSGDSGGPLLVRRSTETIQIGVLNGSVMRRSKLIRCLTTQPTVYANSSLISRWVHEWIERLTSVPITITEVAPATQSSTGSVSLAPTP